MYRHMHKQVIPVHLLRKILSVLITALLFIPVFLSSAEARSESPAKAEIEAVFIYKFLNFIEWPDTNTTGNFNICTIGQSEMNEYIDIIDRKEHKGMQINVIKSVPEKNVSKCRVLFIGNPDQTRTGNLIEKIRESPVLTVASHDGFIESGGIINFIFLDNRVSFEINQQNAEVAGLKISSRLLRLAKKVIKKDQ